MIYEEFYEKCVTFCSVFSLFPCLYLQDGKENRIMHLLIQSCIQSAILDEESDADDCCICPCCFFCWCTCRYSIMYIEVLQVRQMQIVDACKNIVFRYELCISKYDYQKLLILLFVYTVHAGRRYTSVLYAGITGAVQLHAMISG